MSAEKVKVSVRVRPFNKREIQLKTQSIVDMTAQTTILRQPSSNSATNNPDPKSGKTFSFDHCFDSMEDKDGSRQEDVFNCLGGDILDNAFKGYNACIFAYGQTGSGKSYTMMGSQDDPGIIPRLCVRLFDRITSINDDINELKVEVSYMEIYNEKVFDLLDPLSGKKGGLRVREHSVLGPYVDGLSQLVVSAYRDIEALMEEGNKARTVASTNMNNESSRSHAVFTIILTNRMTDKGSGVVGERVSRISLVDLAGSERALKTGAVGARLKEGSNINKSLTTLGLVISKLAESSSKSKGQDKFVPYRDSALTWLLKDSLGGNSRTIMVATLSPSADNYQETLSTLRYADRAKKIVNCAVVNEDPNAKIIRELRSEIDALKEMLIHAANPRILKEKLGENEKLMREVSLTWDQKQDITDQIQEDRRHAMEKMGISIQSSGIKVEKDRFFLVNLNADPSLNELLVYYLNQDVTLVGREDASVEQNIQLSGLGIQPEHCSIEVVDAQLFCTPRPGAKTCINGREIQARTLLEGGDRILWGFNHFFRLNCPKRGPPPVDGKDDLNTSKESKDSSPSVDWRMAQEEVMMLESLNEREIRNKIEKRFLSEKEQALEMQRLEYEKRIENLRVALAVQQDSDYLAGLPIHSSSFLQDDPWEKNNLMDRWTESLSKLREEIVAANLLIREANLLAEELGKVTRFSSTLKIPPHNLTPTRYPGAFLAEPAILVRQGETGQTATWSLDKMESKIILMRDLYKQKESGGQEDNALENFEDPFHDLAQNHELIGVANLYLDPLFHDVKFEYWIPLISPQGEVSGRLKVELEKVGGNLPEDRVGGGEEDSQCSEESGAVSSKVSSSGRSQDENSIVFMLRIKDLRGIPAVYSEFVFCEFTLDGQESHLVLPKMGPRGSTPSANGSVRFEFEQEINLPITDELMELCSEGAISIHVLSQRREPSPDLLESNQETKARSLEEVWDLVSKRVELSLEILELNDAGEYAPVEVLRDDTGAGGHFQIRQGQQKRLKLGIKPLPHSGSLPLELETVLEVSAGCPTLRNRLQKPLDSYQEEDLNLLRETWSHALDKRKTHLQQQIQSFMDIEDKTTSEKEREECLLQQLVQLMEEQNATYSPPEDSKIPGSANSLFGGREGVERHHPALFLHTETGAKYHDLSCEEDLVVPTYGHDSILPKELGTKFISLPIVSQSENEVVCVCSWDSSLHDSVALNKVTDSNQCGFIITRVTVRVSQPAVMDIVLRKRFSFVVVPNRQSLTGRLWKKLGVSKPLTSLGVIYHIVYNIPSASAELENRDSLAAAAASGQEMFADDGESFIEKYSKGISAVDEILRTDRIRQEIALKELLMKQKTVLTPVQTMRKTFSVPNMRQFQAFSLENITGFKPSDSFHEFGSTRGGGAAKMRIFPEEPRNVLRRLTTSKTMVTLREDQAINQSAAAARQQQQTINNLRWCEQKGLLPPDSSSMVSSGYESKALSLSTISDEEQERSSRPKP